MHALVYLVPAFERRLSPLEQKPSDVSEVLPARGPSSITIRLAVSFARVPVAFPQVEVLGARADLLHVLVEMALQQ